MHCFQWHNQLHTQPCSFPPSTFNPSPFVQRSENFIPWKISLKEYANDELNMNNAMWAIILRDPYSSSSSSSSNAKLRYGLGSIHNILSKLRNNVDIKTTAKYVTFFPFLHHNKVEDIIGQKQQWTSQLSSLPAYNYTNNLSV